MPAKTAPVPDRLLQLAAEIEQAGGANLTRLTIVKRWFAGPTGPERMRAFGAWIARTAIVSGLKSKPGGARPLFREARAMLRGRDRLRPAFSDADTQKLWAIHGHLRDFQNTYRQIHWGAVREIKNWNLFLVEKGLQLVLRHAHEADAYDLVASYCRHYDSSTSHALNGPSRERIVRIARFMRAIEADERERMGSKSNSALRTRPASG